MVLPLFARLPPTVTQSSPAINLFCFYQLVYKYFFLCFFMLPQHNKLYPKHTGRGHVGLFSSPSIHNLSRIGTHGYELKSYSSCGPPQKISNGEIRGQEKTTYLTGEEVIYDCVRGFTVGNNANFITCENAAWTEPPECRRIGQSCGAPPVVQNGDVPDLRKLSYPSGSSVKYKCANYYKMEGKETITCRDGEWEKEPICRVPCTVRGIDMQQNNIRFKHIDNNKLYSEHFDNMTFVCIPGYKISDEKRLRIQCLDGVLKYPKCRKKGFCVLQQTEMSRNNIHYNKSNEIENGQTIEFECVEGMVPENGLKETCKNKQITYPKCSTGRPCLPPKISNALISPKNEDGYESGSSIDIKCDDTYVLNGHISVKCENGKWDELPQCFKPCTISAKRLDENHIEIKPSENPPEILEHGTEVNVKCKANFRRPGSLTALCYDAVMKYPRCFSGEICRINQQSLDDNFLELDEKHDNEVFYGEGETVSFKCKSGYSNRTGLTGTCTKPEKEANYGLTYPVCTCK
ncbi:PREDICTED: coagulation factor XIII B chain-like [Nanorana parkeri]|uniref:coagulation factor XIII B chain-like n=1 Tax=Nanorana parkeri TaxID=125878 RepID=UPI000854FB31|nr:PREDICTED: coagulation factor XIII B chain-like [Nanorana parkeri]